MTHGTTYNKSPRRINHKAIKSKTNTETTALERSVEQTTGGFKALLQLANFTLGPDATLNHKKKNRKQNGQLLKVTKMLASQHNELNRKQSGQLLKTVTTMLA